MAIFPTEIRITKLYDQKQTGHYTNHVANFKLYLSVSCGEAGPVARPIMQEWVTDIQDQCLMAKVPFFFKQWGGVQKKRAGRILEGRTWDEMPIRMGFAKA